MTHKLVVIHLSLIESKEVSLFIVTGTKGHVSLSVCVTYRSKTRCYPKKRRYKSAPISNNNIIPSTMQKLLLLLVFVTISTGCLISFEKQSSGCGCGRLKLLMLYFNLQVVPRLDLAVPRLDLAAPLPLPRVAVADVGARRGRPSSATPMRINVTVMSWRSCWRRTWREALWSLWCPLKKPPRSIPTS